MPDSRFDWLCFELAFRFCCHMHGAASFSVVFYMKPASQHAQAFFSYQLLCSRLSSFLGAFMSRLPRPERALIEMLHFMLCPLSLLFLLLFINLPYLLKLICLMLFHTRHIFIISFTCWNHERSIRQSCLDFRYLYPSITKR